MLQQISSKYRGYRTAGVRLTEELMEELESHRTEKFGEKLDAIHAFDKAHIVMLIETGLIDAEDGSAILDAIRQMEAAGVEETRMRAQGGEHSCEQFLIQTLGEDVGGRINLGRSSGDLGEVARRITLRNKLLEAIEALLPFRRALISLAERHVDVVFPAQTFLQAAQPTSLGHWFGMFATVVARDCDRLLAAFDRINQSPAGAGILTGTDFPIDRNRTAQLLGFAGPLTNTFDAILSHDISIEAVSQVALLWSDLARFADDLELWLASGINFIDVPDRFADTSSVMPQKRNPSLPQQVKAHAAKAAGAVTMAFLAERGATGQPIMERNEAENLLWALLDDLPKQTRDLSLLLDALVPDRESMLSAAVEGWSTASDLAGLLVRDAGLSWRSAHQITGIVVRLTEERHLRLTEVSPSLVDEAAQLYFLRDLRVDEAALTRALDPVEAVRRRDLLGGPGPAAQRDQREQLEVGLAKDAALVAYQRGRLESAGAMLEEAIDRLI